MKIDVANSKSTINVRIISRYRMGYCCDVCELTMSIIYLTMSRYIIEYLNCAI